MSTNASAAPEASRRPQTPASPLPGQAGASSPAPEPPVAAPPVGARPSGATSSLIARPWTATFSANALSPQAARPSGAPPPAAGATRDDDTAPTHAPPHTAAEPKADTQESPGPAHGSIDASGKDPSPNAAQPSHGAGSPHTEGPTGPKATGRGPVDREFLPAALEILDTPPSPVRLALLGAICALAAVALVWSWIGRVDVVAVAAGKIQPAGRVKVVQPTESGRILSVSVADGAQVTAGEVLVRLDPREAEADVAASSAALWGFEAEAQRRKAALEAIKRMQPPAEPSWSADIPGPVREREARVLFGEVNRLNADLATLDAQLVQAKAEENRLVTTIEAQQRLLDTQDVRVDMRTELLKRDVGSKAQLLDAQEVRQQQEVNLKMQQGQLGEVRASLAVIARKRDSLIDGSIAENVQRLADVERRIDDTRERLVKARAVLDHLTITAPIAGTVTALAVIGPGQVVTTGQEIMRIVPEGSRLELEVYMPNRDVGFIHDGAPVVVKIDSFPFTRYGTLSGTVARVADDAVADPDVQQALLSPVGGAHSSGVGGTQRMQALVFPVTIALDQQAIEVDGRAIPLSPGMTAVAEVKTGQRRIIDYLFSPLVDVGSRALRER